MGANQSGEETREGPGEGIAAPTGEMKTDFYVLLGVERTADQDEFVGPQFSLTNLTRLHLGKFQRI